MENQLGILLKSLTSNSIPFSEVIAFKEKYYTYQATDFKNGDLYNETTQNEEVLKFFLLRRKII